MKKLVLSALLGVTAMSAIAQDDAVRDIQCKAFNDVVTKNIKNTENAKKNTKSATWLDLGNAYLDLAQNCTSDSVAVAKADNAYKKALEVENAAGGKKSKEIEAVLKSEKLASAYLMQGASFYNTKNYKKAAEYFGKSSEINPKDTTASLYGGIAEQILENNAGALKHLNNYLAGGGNDVSIYYSIAQIYRTEKKFDQAIDILKKGINANPKNKDLPNELINVYLASNNVEKAIGDLEGLVKSDPNNIINLTNLGMLYDSKAQDLGVELGKVNSKIQENNTDKLDKKLLAEQDKLSAFESEITSLNAKLKRDPKTAAATKKRLAEVIEQKAEIEKEVATLISDIQKKKSAAASSSSELDAKAKDLSAKQKEVKTKAADIYNKALAKDPNNYDALYNLAVMHFNDAVETKKVVDIMDIATYRKEGKAIEDKACAQFAASKPFFERASKVKPDDAGVKENIENLTKILEQCNK